MIARTALLAALAAAPALANDSEAGLSAGGLVFELRQNDQIEMVSEDLYISVDRVRVDYQFVNHGDQDATITVAFPMPDLRLDLGVPLAYYNNDTPGQAPLSFHVTVDGQPVATAHQERATLNGRDVTDQVLAAGLPLNPFFAAHSDREPATLTSAQQGLMQDGWPEWTYESLFHWQQTFPAGKTIAVSHEYRPMAGGALIAPDEIDASQPYWAQFCPEADFIAGANRLMRRGDAGFVVARMVGYILTTGGNWRGPITDFRLTVEKPAANTLVSFCASGVTKTSPTTFEVRRKDFTPDADLNILWIIPPGG
ncbi:MAG: DUF4424 family protein [Paracoccus sp. (in: a-proteobacteria)]|uniref:DUF4424 family protein n=1 Tax=Paracoccus sp. TaxID=267 RepID=UPI0026DF1EA9|nr:DUF4424 family protein [Paracoccus sp. (in: a-proteobacteria)]MDO5632496.1 DUF4424 family protein [Paracoccus sp. (in: a-proteobacteria)]